MTFTSSIPIRSTNMIAMLVGIAVIFALTLFWMRPSNAAEQHPNVLAAELLIVRDDLSRLMSGTNLSPAHVRGLQNRITGSLGILPWLLRRAGDVSGADQVRVLSLDLEERSVQLDLLVKRYPLDLSPYASGRQTPRLRREAIAIHETYCASCHDDAGSGDRDTPLPARDLFLMARESAPEVLLARLINGVKGDETLLFTNPLSPKQIGALWRYYQEHL